MTWPLVTQLTTAIPGDGFDGWQNYWNQWWIKVAVVDRVQNPFHTDLLYYPTGVDLYFHTLNPFNGLTTLPIQLVLGLIPAYNAVVFLSWPLAGFGTYLLVRQLLYKQRAAHFYPPFIAGLIFTFAPFHMAHLLGHMQVMSLQWIPFYVLYLLRATDAAQRERPWLRSALLAGLFLTFTGLCDWYFVLYLFFFTGLVLFWQWGQFLWNSQRIQQQSRFQRFVNLALTPFAVGAVAGGLMLLLLSPLLLPMLRAAAQFDFMVRPTSDLYILSASVMDFFVPNRLHTLFRPTSFTWPGNQIAPVSERTIALGYVPLLLVVVAWLTKQYRTQRNFWLVSTFTFFVLALGPRWHFGNITAADIPAPNNLPISWTPFALLNEWVPFMRISRSVSRYALMVQLSVAVLAGVGLEGLFTRLNRQYGRQFILGGLTILLLLFEFWVAPFPMSPPDTPAFYETLRTTPAPITHTQVVQTAAVHTDTTPAGDAVLNLPMNYDRPGYLLYQTVHQHPLTVAYISRDDPRTMTERVPLLQHFRHLGSDIIDVDPVVVGTTVLYDLGVGIVVQDRYKMPGGLEREYTAELGNALFAGQPPRYEDDRLTAHTVAPPATLQPYLMLGALNWGPRTESATGTPQRLLARMGAHLHFVHTTPNMQLRIRYRTVPDATLTLMNGSGTAPIVTLPPAPEGATVSYSLAALGVMSTTTLADAPSILFLPAAPDAVWIEQVGFTE